MAEITITAQNFENEVLHSQQTVLLDFWAPWCPPCRALAPIVAELAKEQEGRVKVGKINVDEELELSMRYGVSSIPSILVFKEGALVHQVLGLQTKKALEALL